jgi:anaerobic sulfite reductase subunit B
MSSDLRLDVTESDGDGRGALTPILHRVVSRHQETADVTILALEPLSGPRLEVRPGQFNMLTAFGVGEVAISVSSAPRDPGPIQHSVRDVGQVTHALCRSRVGDLIGVRGPFGTDWRVSRDDIHSPILSGGDVVVMAGGIGLAPLRGAVHELVARAREGGGRVFVLVGAREPAQIVFNEDLAAWERDGARVLVSVDRGSPQWRGRVGLVTTLLADAGFDASSAAALICGPEIMMRFSARALVDMGVDPHRILVSLERNMQCGLGWCGHCQLGPFILCRDGPVVPYTGVVSHLLSERER